MRHVFALMLLALSGCGAVMSPFMVRLDAEQQKEVDGAWNNMFTPPARLDRELLLDVLCEYQVLQMGADRIHVTAEKYLAKGKAVMEADFDRANPDADQLTILVLDAAGHTVRRERYLRAEIAGRLPVLKPSPNGKDLVSVIVGTATRPAGAETPEERRLRLEREKRQARVRSATQPAGGL